MIRRIFTASVLFAFVGVFFAVPLWAVLSMCTMPCCHQQSSPQAALGSDMGCHTDCIVVAADDTLAASTIVAPVQHDVAVAPAIVVVDVARPIAIAVASDAAPPPRAGDAPLHLLNSLFRI